MSTDDTSAADRGPEFSDGLGPNAPKRKGIGDLIDELVNASVSLELAQRPQSIQLNSFRVERLEEEVRARLDELAALLRDAHEALDARIEDAAELVFERQAAWRGFRADRVEKMVAELDKSRAVAARLRSEIGG